uniref:Uncharacterized protein n=1 Tax=Oryza meridionalis TaxID=40149 RepID=A0A0E0CV08_9ORYZ
MALLPAEILSRRCAEGASPAVLTVKKNATKILGLALLPAVDPLPSQPQVLPPTILSPLAVGPSHRNHHPTSSIPPTSISRWPSYRSRKHLK